MAAWSELRVVDPEASSSEVRFVAQLRQQLQLIHFGLGPLLTVETQSSSPLTQLELLSCLWTRLPGQNVLQLNLEQTDVLHPLFVVEVTLAQDGQLDPDLLAQQGSLIVAVQQLFAQGVPLSDHLEFHGQIRDIAGGEDPVGGAVNRDLQGLVGEGGLAQHKKHDTSLDVYFKLKM
ncbi:hypothetical protein INR49_011397, partial [Caranx melampygus]